MSMIHLRFLALLFVAALTTQTPIAAAESPTAKDEQAILKIEHDGCLAYLHSDVGYLDKVFTDDYTVTNGRAEVNNKAQELKEVRDKIVRYTEFENHDQTLRIHGETGVVTGRTTVKGRDNSDKEFAVEVKFTDTFTKIDGQWRMLASHSSRIPDPTR